MKRIISTILLIIFIGGAAAGLGYFSNGFKKFDKDTARDRWKELTHTMPWSGGKKWER